MAQTDRPTRHALVTGGAGFIGSHLTDALLARGDHVTVVDNLWTGRRANLPAEHPRLRFIEANLRDALAAFGAGESFDEVYHLAAAVGVGLVMAQPIRAIETNVEETAALLRFVAARPRRDGQRGIPTLIASSSEVYGKSAKSPFSEEDDAVYGPTTVGRWSYACSKAIDEYLALAYAQRDALPVVVVRFFNTVGPRQVGEYGMVLPRFVHAARADEPLTVYGDGSASRCFCDVRDVVQALPRLLEARACHGRVFNLGSDRPITIATLADLVVRTLGSRSTIRRVPYSEAFPAGFEDLKQRQPDLARIRAAIGFAPAIPLERTIQDVASAMEAVRA
ncbi:MAG: NAD-dependent epimerase/dehydratase family protein [Phycisphaerae bacterium]|nr:NAD-dependent epimerase/dehydratase family protein [Phycisphaerae bacterium]